MTTNSSHFPTPAEAETVARFASAQHAAVGYSGYWDAASLTWASRFSIHVYPVSPCGERLCAFQLHRVASWYYPRGAARTYLVLDQAVRQISLRALPPTLGRPIASATVGQLEVYAFGYDIARDFGPPLKGPQP
jgi:hypothetical protein